MFEAFRKHSFSHGIHPPTHKELTKGLEIKRLPFADELIILLSQHLGAPAKVIVNAGQEVVRGEPIAEAGGFVSVPMHAPASGIITKIDLCKNMRGEKTPAIYLKPYSGASQDVLYGADQDIEHMEPKDLIQAVQNTGVVGLGGAAFPTHVKLSVPEDKSIDTVIGNGCECEPYLTTDHRVMVEYANDIVHGMKVVMKAVGAKQGIIGLEDNKPDAVQSLTEAAAAEPTIRVQALPTKYPQGAEKMLTKAILNREIPSAGLPSDVGVAVFNVATLSQIGELLPRQQGLIERVVTITGPGVKRPGNYIMALGTPLQFILDHVGVVEEVGQIILGGPMMGPVLATMDVPLTKGVTGILVLRTQDIHKPGKVYPCIKCGSCIDACPMHLNPSRLGMLARAEQYEPMSEDYHLMDCFECGCCSYVCPANIPLVQQFRIAKGIIRERKAKSA